MAVNDLYQQQLEVLVIVDDFTPEFAPLTYDKPWGFNQFNAFRFVDLCLEWVSWLESPNVIVAFANHPEELALQLQKKWASNFKQLQTFTYQNCHSINDVLRDVESQHLLKGDFILIPNCATFCSSNIAKQIENFKVKRRQNKNNILTLLYSEKSNINDDDIDDGILYKHSVSTFIGYHTQTYKLIQFEEAAQEHQLVSVPKSAFIAETTFRTDLIPCGIALCAHEFSGHFAGNYDFHSFEGIVHDILSNEEFLAQHIHLDFVNDACAMTIDNYPALFRAHQALLRRRCFPLTFENVLPVFTGFDQLKHQLEQNIYSPELEKLVKLVDGSLKLKDTMLGKNCKIGDGSTVDNCSFGSNIFIGRNSIMHSVIGYSEIKIGDESQIECSVIGNKVCIGKGAKIHKGCVIGAAVQIPEGAVLTEGTIIMGRPWVNNEKEAGSGKRWRIENETIMGDYFKWILCIAGKPKPFWHSVALTSFNNSSDDIPSASNIELNTKLDECNTVESTSQEANAFMGEVIDSMRSVLNDASGNSSSGRNTELLDKMKLEINSSKLAYNIPTDDVAKDVFLAFLKLPGTTDRFATFKKMYINWRGLWQTFYRRKSSHAQMLAAIEEVALSNKEFRNIVPNVLHFLNQGEELFDDALIVDWYTNMDEDSPIKKVDQLGRLVKWLENDHVDSDTESTVETDCEEDGAAKDN